MLNLSDSSLKKVMECVDIQYANRITICELRRCSFRMNKLAIQNNFHRLKAGLTLFSNCLDVNDDEGELWAIINRGTSGLDKAQDLYSKNQLDPEHMIPDDYNRLVEEVSVFNAWTTTDINKRYPIDESDSEGKISFIVEQALNDSQLKLRSINALKLENIELNSDILTALKRCSVIISLANTVHVDNCTIKWTSTELMEFLQLFKKLKDIDLSGKFEESIVTDEHLSLISDRIRINNDAYNLSHFPGVTAKSCENWSKNGIKSVVFGNISTEFSITNITEVFDNIIERQSKKELYDVLNRGFGFIFGALKYSEHREVILAQRNINTEWTVRQGGGGAYQYQVFYNESNLLYIFYIEQPYEKPNLPKMLETIHQLRAEAEDENFDVESLGYIEERSSAIHSKLVDLQFRFDLPHPQYLDVDIAGLGLDEEEVEEINDENFPRFWRRQLMADITRIERLIRERMGQFEEPVPEEEVEHIEVV